MSSRVNKRRDIRPLAIAVVVIGVLFLGGGILLYPKQQGGVVDKQSSPAAPVVPEQQQSTAVVTTVATDNSDESSNALRQRLDQRYQQAVMMLHAKRYEHALVALDAVLAIDPNLPEAYINAGFALLGLQRYDEADLSFTQAIDLRPQLANAYYGLAMALEGRGQIRAAMGAMQIYLHRAGLDDPYRRKAESAVWEWQEALKGQQQPESMGTEQGVPLDGVGFETSKGQE